MKSVLCLITVSLALTACAIRSTASSVTPNGPGAVEPSSAVRRSEHVSFTAEDAGLKLVVVLDQVVVKPGASITAHLTLMNGRPDAVMFDEPCHPQSMTVDLAVPVEPIGRAWDGIAGAFKTYALDHGQGSPMESSTRTPLRTLAEAGPCHPALATLAAGASFESTLTWNAELVRDVPAAPGQAPFAIQVLHDQTSAGNGMTRADTLEIKGTITVAPGESRAVSAAEAVDSALGDTDFAAWLAQQPRRSWANVNLFLQPAARGVAALPTVPYWDVELYREPRNWAIVLVDAASGNVLKTAFCNRPCDR